MLHPNLGRSLDSLATWQVDTDEISTITSIYNHHLSDLEEPEQLSSRLGLLWKKLGGTSRLARLVWEYTELQVNKASASQVTDRSEVRFIGRFFEAMGRPSRRPASRPLSAEFDPLYDQWIDG